MKGWVEAFAASWIEIGKSQLYSTVILLSKPLRLRGLKFIIHGFYNITPGVEAYAASWIEIQQTMEKYKKVLSRSLCGFVD